MTISIKKIKIIISLLFNVKNDFINVAVLLISTKHEYFRWISKYCPEARFIMKVDDDIVINIFKLLPYLRKKKVTNYYPTNIISCNLWENRKPERDIKSKWYVSEVGTCTDISLRTLSH